MKWLKSYNENSKFRNDLLLFNLDWKELVNFLEDRNFDIPKLGNLNKPTNKFLNKGKSGLVYEYDSDKVIKVSSDLDDFRIFLKLKDKNFKHFPRVYDVLSINNGKNSLLFILMEKCENLPEDIHDFINENFDIVRQYLLHYYIDGKYMTSINRYSSWLYDNTYDIYHNTIKKYDLGRQLFELSNELLDINIINDGGLKIDLHIGNIMMKNGELCIIDFLVPKRYRKNKNV